MTVEPGDPVAKAFGRYQLLGLLGRGGMGEVWRAHDSVTDRIVAIKTLPAQFSDDEMFQQRFRREAQSAARLNSPHVIPIYDYGEIDGRLFVCMRLIEGHDLQAVLADGPIAPGRAVRIIEQVAKALHAAHDIGLVHRDVKPSNVLLDKDDYAYLIDFGIARALDDTRLTNTGGTIGTLAYMAPERLGDHPDEDARADIYALACVLYECLTGGPPFPGSVERILMAHLNTPPPQPSTAQPKVPAQFDEVIATGMAKDPDQRYATTVELASAAHDAVTAPPTTPTQPTLIADATRITPSPARPGDCAPPAPVPATQQRPHDDGDRAGRPDLPPETQPAVRPPDQIGTPPPRSMHRPRRRLKWPLIAALAVILAAAVIRSQIDFGAYLGFVVDVVAILVLVVSYREFWARVRPGALMRAAAVLVGASLMGILVGWGLVEMLPGSLERPDRLPYVANQVIAFGLADSDLFVGHPHPYLNAVLGLFGALALIAALIVLFQSVVWAHPDQRPSPSPTHQRPS